MTTSTSASSSHSEILKAENLKSFRFDVLLIATRYFHPNSELGEGRFSTVYKGWIDEQSCAATEPEGGTAVAVKRLNKYDSIQSDQEWLAEINYFGRINHPNVVKLIGYCLEGDHRLLVYEFMPRGSLANHLFIRGSHFQCLSWNNRIKVALGVAKGLAYLHTTEEKPINLYFKSSNILIDSDYNAKLSDFGLVKRIKNIDPRFIGAASAYVAPEYLMTGMGHRVCQCMTPHMAQIHCHMVKCEIYSFGVVLLELLTGRRGFDKNLPPHVQMLVELVKPILTNKKKFLNIMDPSIDGQYSYIAARRAALLANRCVMTFAGHRPNADKLVEELEKIQEL
ncbi:hypothetical protein M8C21_009454 [Ambrosia artemisiifolia]|uniref:non-specific serine/threonine protein kinase n=1 Tax=Ambrosia artemisiifolia TaxID=4212 RepID=A0AAD5D7H1_AMBAR|nr:hypothetical protein M8C21_009454 [Ambrosia artemisiifolia]